VADQLEDPRKTHVREQLAAALDSAGFDVDESRSPVPYPNGTTLTGPGIKADVSCADSEGTRHLYFVRLDGSKPLPGWLINNASVASEMDGVDLHVAVTADCDELRASCIAFGVGLVRLRNDNTVETLLEYAPPSEVATQRQHLARVKDVRRRLETKVELRLGELQTRFDQIGEVTAGMPKAMRVKYRARIEEESVDWQEWLSHVSEELDAVSASGDAARLTELEVEIQQRDPQ
jgi:hypothetical protein